MNATNGRSTTVTQSLIELEGVGKIYRSPLLRRPKPALADLDLSVQAGEIFGFLGPNGAGKTTTIKILLGLVRPTSGGGTVLGEPFGSAEARRSLGFLPDTPSFYRYLSAREYLHFVGELREMRGAALRKKVDETLERVRVPSDSWDRQLRTHSRGMLQRTGIAAAILHGPKLVILDEPMNGLDPLGRHEFRDLLLSLKSEGAAVFLSTHVLADIENVADRVAILDHGRLVECGPLADILTGGGRAVEIEFELRGGVRPGEIAQGIDELTPAPRGWIARVSDPDRACRVVQRILDSGGRVHEFGPRRISLEEFFLERVAGHLQTKRSPSSTSLPRPPSSVFRSDRAPSNPSEVRR
jgi:ABC-2 type transport system ATP-binding protein